MKLKRKRVGDQKYHLLDAETGRPLAVAVKTGTHLDDYPWDWYLLPGVYLASDLPSGRRNQGVSDALHTAVDEVEALLGQFGVLPEVTHWRAIGILAQQHQAKLKHAEDEDRLVAETSSSGYRELYLANAREAREQADEILAAIEYLKEADK